MATTITENRSHWSTIHKNGPYPLKKMQTTKLISSSSGLNDFERYKDVAVEMRNLIKQAADSNESFRAIGSRWSMSNIAHCKDRMQYNAFMNLKFNVFEGEVHQNTSYKHADLYWFQCGNQIKEISNYLESKGKSLKTSGASNGQTIAGCISTGVHGSTLDIGSMQDFVVGINLITGPNAADNVYIERASKPALRDSYFQNLDARIIRDDDIFNAAVVGLGSMGFIHGVVIEAEDLFLLHRYVKKIPKVKALELADSLDFSNFDPQIPGFNYIGVRPFHYKVFMNPYNENESDYAVEFIYKMKYFDNYKAIYGNPIPFQKQFIYLDLLYLFIKIAEKFPGVIKTLISALKTSILPDEETTTVGKLSEIFWDTAFQGKAYACSFGVSHTNSSKALSLLAKLTRDNPVPGMFAMRFVKQTEATLGFSKFPFTCMVEIDGIQWSDSDNLISLNDYAKKMIEVLKSNNIPFTIHWGKVAQWSHPGLVDHMYGNKVKDWKRARNKLLTIPIQDVFTNNFIKAVKLHEPLAPGDLIV